jgi:hypothetical protein
MTTSSQLTSLFAALGVVEDPSRLGYLMDPPTRRAIATVAFAAVALLCLWTWYATRRLPLAVRDGASFFWLLAGALLALLAANRQLQLEALAATDVRPAVVASASPLSNQGFQLIMVLVIASIGFGAFMRLALVPDRQAPVLALAGLVALLCEIPLLALSMTQIDGVLGRAWGLLSVRTILELAALACVGSSAVWLLLTHRRSRGADSWDPLVQRGLR